MSSAQRRSVCGVLLDQRTGDASLNTPFVGGAISVSAREMNSGCRSCQPGASYVRSTFLMSAASCLGGPAGCLSYLSVFLSASNFVGPYVAPEQLAGTVIVRATYLVRKQQECAV